MANFIAVVTELVNSTLDLMVIISGSRHGVLQGTHEAVLAEAQGAQIGPVGFNHLTDMQGTLRDIVNREAALNSTLNKLAGEHPNLGIRLRNVLSPLLQQSGFYRSAIQETEKLAVDLAQTNGQRLSGVTFGQGGAGPDVGRGTQALISTQITQRSKELAERGISEPTKLVPAARAAGNQVLGTIRQLPLSIRDAMDKVVAVIGSVRVLLTQAARQALLTSNGALAQALNSVERALALAASRFGSSLTTPIIFINVRAIKRAAGIFDPEDGA